VADLSEGRFNAWAEPATVAVLHPGDVALGRLGDRLETLLGSCISIILTDPRRTVAVMCHIVHSGATPVDERGAETTHAEPALAAMFEMLQGCGISPHLCEAYLYGGGNMFPALFPQAHVGQSNAEWAVQALADLGIRLLVKDTGGTAFRRINWTVGRGAPEVRLGET
jgi:chemotaxis protein CheD